MRRRNWAQLLRQVFEVDPLRCDKCAGVMKIISFITTSQEQVIKRILEHQDRRLSLEHLISEGLDMKLDG